MYARCITLDTCPHLFVSLQLLNEGALIEESMQTFLSVVVAQVLEGCAALALSQSGVLKARCVHNEQRAQGVLAGFQGPEAHRANTHTHTPTYTQTLALRYYYTTFY